MAVAPVDLESALAAPWLRLGRRPARCGERRAAPVGRVREDHGGSSAQPIGAFQGIKHALADNYVSVERARSLTYAAAARLGEPRAGPATGAVWTSQRWPRRPPRCCGRLCAHAVQVHGALGQTWEHDAHLYVRHAWQGAAHAGRQPRAVSRGGPPILRGRRRDARSSAEFGAWLAEFLPDDYYANYRQYRWDTPIAARLPACGVRGRMAAADLAPRAWRPVTGLA